MQLQHEQWLQIYDKCLVTNVISTNTIHIHNRIFFIFFCLFCNSFSLVSFVCEEKQIYDAHHYRRMQEWALEDF